MHGTDKIKSESNSIPTKPLVSTESKMFKSACGKAFLDYTAWEQSLQHLSLGIAIF